MKLPRKTRGYSLVEVAAVSVLLALLVAGYLANQYDGATTQLAQAQAQRLVALNSAVQNYESVYYSKLVAGTSVSGVANALAPTVGELLALGVLDSTFNPANFYGGSYAVQLSKLPAGCVNNCNVTGITYLTTPVTDPQGHESDSLAGAALLELGGNGAVSTQAQAASLAGINSSFSVANPLGTVPGILAMRNGYGAQGFTPYVRRDGSVPATGNINLNGNSIVNAGTANTQNVVNTGNLSNSGNMVNNGDIRTQTLKSTGRMTVNEFIALQGKATLNTPCTPNGLLGQDGYGELLSCQSGLWADVGTTEIGATDSGNLSLLTSPYVSYPSGTIYFNGPWGYDSLHGWFVSNWSKQINPIKNGLYVANIFSQMCRRLVNQSGLYGQYSVTATLFDNDNGQTMAQATTLSPQLHDDCMGAELPVSAALPKNTGGYTLTLSFGYSVYPERTPYNRANIYDLLGNVDEEMPYYVSYNDSLFY